MGAAYVTILAIMSLCGWERHAKPDPRHAKDDVTKSPDERARAAGAEVREDYSGMSRR